MKRYTTFDFDVSRFDFVSVVRSLFDGQALEDLHEKHDELFKVSADSKTMFHQKFYDKYRAGWPEMLVLYRSFVGEVARTIEFSSPILYQKFPTFRVHLRGNVAVGAFHNDASF